MNMDAGCIRTARIHLPDAVSKTIAFKNVLPDFTFHTNKVAVLIS